VFLHKKLNLHSKHSCSQPLESITGFISSFPTIQGNLPKPVNRGCIQRKTWCMGPYAGVIVEERGERRRKRKGKNIKKKIKQ
jgi:hypothetical protein